MSEELLKFKLEVQKEQKELRHEIRNEMQRTLSTLEINMEKQLSEIKADMKEGFNDIRVMFKELPSSFATKEEHKINALEIQTMKEKQARTDKIFAFISSIIWTAVIWAILTLIIKTNV